MPYTVYILLHVCSMYLIFQTTMPQRSLSVYFSPLVPPLPHAQREDVIDTLLYFRFKDRITGHKRQKAEVPSDPESVDDEALSDNHLEERLLDQAQARASYTPLFWGHLRSIPQGMILDVQPLVKSLFCPIRPSPNGFFDFEASTP